MPTRIAIACCLAALGTMMASAPVAAAEDQARDLRFPLASHASADASEAPASKSPPAEPASTERPSFLPLAPSSPRSAPRTQSNRTGAWPSVAGIGGSLAVVVGLFLVVVWLSRRSGGTATTPLPKEVFEVLGRAPLAPRNWAGLVRCGRKLLLVSFTPTGVDTLTEITDPAEIDRLTGLC
ncbi:MAG: flagellar biosynthetic protein FliO, partial [Pirellulales bacterium]